ncbi:hypothetical protein FHT13_001479 [Xanthomonas arboricola]|nr:hypothetical protein [Xanthomonas arboricola]
MKGGPTYAVTLSNPTCPLRQQLREDIRGGGFGLTALSGRNDLGVQVNTDSAPLRNKVSLAL